MILKDRIIFVTGGTGVIGKAIVKVCAREGAQVVFSYHTRAHDAECLVEEVETEGRALMRPLGVRMDVRSRKSVSSVFAEIETRFGRLDGLVNNAGVNNPIDFNQLEDDDWDRILAINLKGPFICTQVAFELLKKSTSGSVVHIGSVSGQYGGPRTAHYAASKAGLISLGQVIARFGAAFGIRSNTVAAGFVESEMASGSLNNVQVQEASKNVLLKRFAQAEEIADSVVYLLSANSSYITAQTINVNGGLYF